MTWTSKHRKNAAIARALRWHERTFWGPFVWAIIVIRESGEGTVHAGNHPWCEEHLPKLKQDNPGCQVTMERLHPYDGPIRRPKAQRTARKEMK